MFDVKSVWFNGGAGREKEFALVVAEHPDTKLDLIVFSAEGVTGHANGIPRREPADYGPEGGGDTWFLG